MPISTHTSPAAVPRFWVLVWLIYSPLLPITDFYCILPGSHQIFTASFQEVIMVYLSPFLQSPSTCPSSSSGQCLSPSSSWGPSWLPAAADASGPSRNRSWAGPREGPAWWRPSPWSRAPAPRGVPPPASPARLPAPAPAPTRGPGHPRPGPRPTVACPRAPWTTCMWTCPRTSLCSIASRPPRSCPIRGSTSTPPSWGTLCSQTQCPWPRCPHSWMGCRRATGSSRLPSLTLTVNRRCTQRWPCNSEGSWGPGPDGWVGAVGFSLGLGKVPAWKPVPVGVAYGTVLLDGFICPQTVWKIFLQISLSRFVYPGEWLIYDGKEQSLEIPVSLPTAPWHL